MKDSDESLEIPYRVRQYVFDRDAWCCQNEFCKNRFGKYDNLTIHHIIPKSANGLGTDPCNLITLCWDCHDNITLLKDKIEGCAVTDPEKLIHREPAYFYDHEFKENYIKCSHVKSAEKIEKEKESTEQGVKTEEESTDIQ